LKNNKAALVISLQYFSPPFIPISDFLILSCIICALFMEMEILMKKISLLLSAFFLISCGSNLQRFSNEQTIQPETNMGVVVFAARTNIALSKITISGTTSATLDTELFSKEHDFVVTTLPAGEYEYSKVYLFYNYRYLKLGGSDELDWTFTVKPNAINYVGHLDIFNEYGRYFVQNKNESTLAIEFLEKEYPDLLKKYPLVYGKNGIKDEFFEFIGTLEGADDE